MKDFYAVQPSRDEVRGRLRANFTGGAKLKSGRVLTLNLRVGTLSAEVARVRTMVLAIPVYEACAKCHGAGFLGPFPCVTCDATGYTEDEERIGTPWNRRCSGAPQDLSLERLGVRNLKMRNPQVEGREAEALATRLPQTVVSAESTRVVWMQAGSCWIALA